MSDCDHKYISGQSAIEQVWFYEKDKYGKSSLQINYEFCTLCGKKFTVSG